MSLHSRVLSRNVPNLVYPSNPQDKEKPYNSETANQKPETRNQRLQTADQRQRQASLSGCFLDTLSSVNAAGHAPRKQMNQHSECNGKASNPQDKRRHTIQRPRTQRQRQASLSRSFLDTLPSVNAAGHAPRKQMNQHSECKWEVFFFWLLAQIPTTKWR